MDADSTEESAPVTFVVPSEGSRFTSEYDKNWLSWEMHKAWLVDPKVRKAIYKAKKAHCKHQAAIDMSVRCKTAAEETPFRANAQKWQRMTRRAEARVLNRARRATRARLRAEALIWPGNTPS